MIIKNKKSLSITVLSDTVKWIIRGNTSIRDGIISITNSSIPTFYRWLNANDAILTSADVVKYLISTTGLTQDQILKTMTVHTKKRCEAHK